MVARVQIAIPLENRNVSTDRAEQAQRVLLTKRGPCRLLDDLHLHPADVCGHPFVKDSAQELPPGFGLHGLRADAARRRRLSLDQRKKADVRGADPLEEAV